MNTYLNYWCTLLTFFKNMNIFNDMGFLLVSNFLTFRLRRPWVCAFSTFYQTFRGEHRRIDATPFSSINASELWKCWRHSAKPSSWYQRNDFVRLVHIYFLKVTLFLSNFENCIWSKMHKNEHYFIYFLLFQNALIVVIDKCWFNLFPIVIITIFLHHGIVVSSCFSFGAISMVIFIE